MDEMTAFERQVAREVVREAGPEPRLDALAISHSATSQSPTWRFQAMFSASKYVVAGAIVALFGGLLLAGLLTTRSDEADSTDVRPVSEPYSIPSQLPDGVRSGTLDTPIGTARWVHVAGTADTMPAGWDPVRTPSGFAVLDDATRRLWHSPDLLTWTELPMPIEQVGGAWLSRVGETFWLNAEGRDEATLWRSSDLASWEQIDTTALTPPGPEGLLRAAWFGEPASSDDATVVPVAYELSPVGEFLGLPDVRGGGFGGLTEIAPGVYQLRNIKKQDRSDWPVIRFEEIPDGMRVVDHVDGTVLAERIGIGPEFLEYLLAWDAQDADVHPFMQYAVDRALPIGQQLTLLEGAALAPGEPRDGIQGWSQLASTGEAVAIVTHHDEGQVQVEASEDGHEWQDLGFATDPDGGTLSASVVWADDGGIKVRAIDGAQWHSQDGSTWTMIRSAPPYAAFDDDRFRFSWFDRETATWVSVPEPTDAVHMAFRFVQPDGSVIRTDLSDLGIVAEIDTAGGVGGSMLDERTFIWATGSEELDMARDLWILSFGSLHD